MNILRCNCLGSFSSVGPTVLRAVVGIIFIVHGYQKVVAGVPTVAGMLGGIGYPLPEVMAILLIAAELVGGLFLVIGLFTHWTAKVLTVVSVLALVTVHLKNGFSMSNGGYEYILLILASCVAILLMGPGKWALDTKLKKQ